jgi:hypothetical protein
MNVLHFSSAPFFLHASISDVLIRIDLLADSSARSTYTAC